MSDGSRMHWSDGDAATSGQPSRQVDGQAPHRPERDLTVVIPTLGRPILRDSLEALRACDPRPAAVIVVDQGASEETAVLLEEFRARGLDVRHIRSTQTGRAAGVNRGLELVETRFVAVTDDDCLAAPDWVTSMTARLHENAGAIITGRVDPGEGDVVLAVVTAEAPDTQSRPRLKFDLLSGGNMGMPIELLKRVGMLDEDPCIRAAEDAEFAYRALRAGVRIVYSPDVIVRHMGWRGEGAREAQYRLYARSQGSFFGKYLRRGDAWIALRTLVYLVRSFRRWTLGTLRGDRESARHGRAYFTGLLPGIIAGWRSGRAP
jgi:GT2 family glycosyltransferase